MSSESHALADWRVSILPLILGACLIPAAYAAQSVLVGPALNGAFGTAVTVLPNGHLVITDPGFDSPTINDIGAVSLYQPDGTLVSRAYGSTTGDFEASRIVLLASGNFLVALPRWDHGGVANAGAVVFGSASAGIEGVIGSDNALVGQFAGDLLGESITALQNGNYVILCAGCDQPSVANAGAVGFGSGLRGAAGVISPTNSLFGTTTGDLAPLEFVPTILELANGNFIVRAQGWDRGTAVNAGAVTFVSGQTGLQGFISPTNSLVGSQSGDRVGHTIRVLSSGDYVVISPFRDLGTIPDAGAVTLGSGTMGVVGEVSSSNSILGSRANDRIGNGAGFASFADGDFGFSSPFWDHGDIIDAGAVTFISRSTGTRGSVSAENSLVGGSEGDRVGQFLTALSNGNLVIGSPLWDRSGIVDAGAATFVSGTSRFTGLISSANSLVGSSDGDQVAAQVVALSNGNYVVSSPLWGLTDEGAATFGSGITGIRGPIVSTNSLVGSRPGDAVGSGVVPLTGGGYVVLSPGWDLDALIDRGAATFGSGESGITGTISAANSLVGSRPGDLMNATVVGLSNGHYVVASPFWDLGNTENVGAVTFGNGQTGIVGTISTASALIGGSMNDQIGFGGIRALPNGNYVIDSPGWDFGNLADVGAVTFGNGTSGSSGVISAANSLIGSRSGDRLSGELVTLTTSDYLVVSRSWDHDAAIDAGAITLGSGTTGVSGVISPSNSIVGSRSGDRVGTATGLDNGQFLILSRTWSDEAGNRGAVTLGLSNGSVVGPLTDTHSVFGSIPDNTANIAYDALRNQLAVGQPTQNRVILHRSGQTTQAQITGQSPHPSTPGQSVRFQAIVTAAEAPVDGRMIFVSTTGERCEDLSATALSPTEAGYSCEITFVTEGSRNVHGEYVGSLTHAYSRTGQVTQEVSLYRDGFEAEVLRAH